MSDWLKVWLSRGIVCTLIGASFTLLAASSVELARSSQTDSCLHSESCISPDVLSYGAEALHSLVGLFMSGVEAVRKHPLKALTLYLAMQNKENAFRMAGADALVASNINQNLTYDIDGPAVSLLPIIIGTGSSPCNATIELRDIYSGNLISTATKPQKFSQGVWKAQGTFTDINTLLATLSFTPARGYNKTIYLDSTVLQVLPTNASATSYERILEIVRQNSATARGVIQIDVFMLTSSTSTQSSLASSTEVPSLSTFVTNVTDLVTNSPESTIQTLNISGGTTPKAFDTSSTQVEIQPSEPSYGLIGGVIGGVVLSCGVLAGLVAYRQGLCSPRMKSSVAKQLDNELGNAHLGAEGAQSHSAPNAQYGDLTLAVNIPKPGYELAPEPLNQGYESLPEAALPPQAEPAQQLNAGYDPLPISPQKNRYVPGPAQKPPYAPGPVQKSPYELPQAPLS